MALFLVGEGPTCICLLTGIICSDVQLGVRVPSQDLGSLNMGFLRGKTHVPSQQVHLNGMSLLTKGAANGHI